MEWKNGSFKNPNAISEINISMVEIQNALINHLVLLVKKVSVMKIYKQQQQKSLQNLKKKKIPKYKDVTSDGRIVFTHS